MVKPTEQPARVRRQARAASPRAHHPLASITDAVRELTTPLRLNPFATTAAGVRTVATSRDGLLLLGSALALLVVALASGSLLRLLRQMEGVRLR